MGEEPRSCEFTAVLTLILRTHNRQDLEGEEAGKKRKKGRRKGKGWDWLDTLRMTLR